MNLIIKYTIFILALFVINISYAQPDLETGSVEIVKNFDATLEETDRLDIKPELPELDTSKKHMVYEIPEKTINVEYPAPKIKPIAIKRERLPTAYDGFLKVGYGIPNAILGNLAYAKKFNKKLRLGIDLFHHSSSNSKKINNQKFSKSGGYLDGNYRLGQGMAVKSTIGYVHDQYGLYGYDHDIPNDTTSAKQIFRTYSGSAKFYNDKPTLGNINYFAAIDFYRLNDDYATHETGTKLSGGLVKYIAEKHPIGIKFSTDFTTLVDTATQNLNVFQLTPSFGYHHDMFNIKVAAILQAYNDDYSIFPDVEATANVLGTKLAVFVGWKGDSYKNTFKRLTNINPYLVSRTKIGNSTFTDYFGGVKGNTTWFDYNVSGGYRKVNDMAMFQVNTADLTRYDVVYDTVKVAHFGGGIDLHVMKDLTLLFNFNQNIFTPNLQEKVWFTPSLDVNIAARYKALKNKLFLKSDFIIQNGVSFINDKGNADVLNGLFDVNLGAEYFFTRNIGAFLDLNNLANNKRERWINYPTYGFNFIGGITARF